MQQIYKMKNEKQQEVRETESEMFHRMRNLRKKIVFVSVVCLIVTRLNWNFLQDNQATKYISDWRKI